MVLIAETTLTDTVLPVAELRAHLRLGSGFDLVTEPDEDRALAGFLRAAIAVIERQTGKVLLHRSFRMMLGDWHSPGGQALPVAPVSHVSTVRIVRHDRTRHEIGADRWQLVQDVMRPVIRPAGRALPCPPAGGQIEVRMTAGFASEWADIPGDLALAVLILAAQYYEDRSDDVPRHVLPAAVNRLIEGWRTVRTFAGRRG